MKNLLPFDTTKYNDLPISVVIYQTVYDSDNSIRDFRIVYGNKIFIRDWKKYHRDKIFFGAYLVRDKILNDEVVNEMIKFSAGNLCAFSSYIQAEDIHVHFQPIENLPPPYGGFFLTNVSDYQEKSAHTHFLHAIKQMEIAGVLLKVEEDGKVDCIYASKEFADMMECTVPFAKTMMNGKSFISTTHPDDRLSVKRMLRRRVSEDGTKFLTTRKFTANNKEIWCKTYYTFIDDFKDKYIYVTYTDVTASRVYEQRLRSVYMSIGNNFYRENANTLGTFQVNLTKNKVDNFKGKDLFATDSVIRPYSEVIKLRAENYLIDTEREDFLKTFSVENLIKKYLIGQNEVSSWLFSRRKDGKYCYVKLTALLTRHPISSEVIAFISEQIADNEKVEDILLDKILSQQFDMVSYISNGNYGVVIGDASLIERGSIFPITRTGNYSQYLQNQIIPVLSGDAESKKIMADALNLSTIEKNLREKDSYIVNIACEIDGGIYYKRFDFYAVDPKANFFVLLKSDTTEIQRKQIEQNQRLSEALTEARQANVAKTAFLSRISHEIRTPMNAIIGLDNIALHEKNLSDSMKNHLEKIGTSAHYLLNLINDILDINRIDSGRMLLKSEEFSFRTLIEQIQTLVETQCKDKNLTFDCLISGAIKNYYIGDDTKIKQVLVNILSNAVKFTEPGGKITLSIECTAEFEGTSNFKFKVKDTGIGMSKDYLPKIFEPFSQEDDKNTSKYGLPLQKILLTL